MNVPERFLDPVKDKEPQTLEQELAKKVEKTILSRHKAACFKHELKNGLMRILAVAVWLKLKKKYFLTGTAKEACELFQVRAKQLSRVLTGLKCLGGKKTPVQKGKGKKRKDTPLLTLKKGPRREEMTGTNHPSKADHLSIYTSSSKIVSSITICSQNAFISSSAQKSSRGMASSFIHHIIHCSPFQYRWHIAGPFHNCSPVTTCSCLSPSQLCCRNTCSCDNIGRTLVLSLNFQIAIIFWFKTHCPNSPFQFIISLPNYHIN